MFINWQNIPFIVNVFASAAFLLLTAMSAVAWQGRRRGGLLILSVGTTCLSSALTAYSSINPDAGLLRTAHFVQGGSGLTWLIFLSQLLHPESKERLAPGPLNLWITRSIAAMAVALALAYVIATTGSIEAKAWSQLGLFTQLGIGVLGLILVEQLFRGALGRNRWAIKYLCFGLGGLFAFDVFVHSEAILLGQVDFNLLEARGILVLLLAPLLAVTAARNRHWSIDVFVSRTAVAHSAALLGSGLYLIGVATAGYLIRENGGRWGPTLQLGFLFGACLLLMSLFFSSQFRTHAKIFLAKHFFAYRYDYRDEWLRFIAELTATDGADVPGRAIRAMANFLGSPGGAIWKSNHDGAMSLCAEWRLSGTTLEDFGPDDPLVNFIDQTGWVVNLDEFRNRPDLYPPDLSVPAWLNDHATAWVLIPLGLQDALWGLLLLRRPAVARSLNWEDHDLLKTAGQQVSSYLAFADATERLVESGQFDAFNRLSAYVVHDLKNIAAQLSLLVANSKRFWADPEFQADALSTIENATQRMNFLLADLQKGPRLTAAAARVVDVSRTLESVLDRTRSARPIPILDLDGTRLAIHAEPGRLINVIEHLVENAQHATPDDGKVILRARADNDWVTIEVCDTGCGMDRAFVKDRLFKPFDTTKGNAGMGIGVYESREFARANGGSIEVNTLPNKGSQFLVRFPRVEFADSGIQDSEVPDPDELETGR